MKIAIIQFPGSNCEAESIRAVKYAGMEAEEFLWNANHQDLEIYDGYFIVGGFSYEDRSRAGIIAALDPVMRVIAVEAKKGKPVLGVCNGAQILVETGLVPGLKDNALGMSLAENKRMENGRVLGTGFYNAWVFVKLDVPSHRSAFTRHLGPNDIIHIPVAHGEGRLVMPKAVLKEMQDNQQTTFRYCDSRGDISEEFPINPNGAMYNLAGVINPRGNILAIMPHPERTPDGQGVFTSMRDYIAESQKHYVEAPDAPLTTHYQLPATNPHLSFTPQPYVLQPYQKPTQALELIIDLIITDNTARTVEHTLHELEIHADITRYTHWEIETESNTSHDTLEMNIIKTGELFNSNKEYRLRGLSCRSGQCVFLLVRDQSDTIGQQKTATLLSRFDLPGLRQVTRGILWKISIERGNIEAVLDHILRTHILFNPYSQECYRYGAQVNTRTHNS